MKHRIALLIALVVGYCVFVFALASTLMAQRYEYRATPIETGPITVPCFVVDRFNYLCIETGDIFVNVAIGDGGWQSGHYSQRTARLSAGPNLAAEAGAKVARILTVAPLPAPRSLVSPPSPSIILAHQKIASDAWVDRTKNKKGERCCDAGKDCHSLNPEEVKHVQGGVNIRLGEQTLFIPGEEIMPSEDGRYWVCYWGGQVKCFFAPYSGS